MRATLLACGLALALAGCSPPPPEAHVPEPANFVSLRRVAGTTRASRPWFGLGDFRPITLAQAERTFPGPACQESALPFAGRELEAARALLGALGRTSWRGRRIRWRTFRRRG